MTLVKDYFKQLFNIPVKIDAIVYVFLVVLFLLKSNFAIYYPLALLFVFLHEHGHIFAGRRYCIQTSMINIGILGGVALMQSAGRDRKQKLVIAFAGPLINLILAAISYSLYLIFPTSILITFIEINIVLFLFNMLPMYPMDGGRIANALMLMCGIHITKADKYTSWLTMVVSSCLFVLGIYWHSIFMVLIAGMMFYNAYKNK